ncbi:MAG: HAD-IIB family hydrolase, partial [Acidobacteria bacterium]|nr:HAD-IIB family hydrolase [Acidobacteriota bacterium]
GRDADTGGQTTYVVELARAHSAFMVAERVDLVTRRVEDSRVAADYARELEPLSPGAQIVRLPFGPRRYLRKESLWPYLELFADRVLAHLRRIRRRPDVLHSHYADAGFAGARLESLLRAPLVHTGHSLGRVKLARLLEQGLSREEIEERFDISRRIEAEETALDHAALIVASTRQEAEEQYALYENYRPERKIVIPPGTDLSRFRPPRDDDPEPPIAAEIDRFLSDPAKPLILAIARADPRKNLEALVRAFGESPRLRDVANLAIVAGTRTDLEEMKREPRRELRRLLVAIDRHDLYGHVAYPKRHSAEDVPDLYRLAARRGGLFVNPALTEPFGLTLIEAAASGLPVVATADGGPHDILEACDHGVLIDPLDVPALGRALEEALDDRERWRRWATNGPIGARRHYRWSAHVDRYLDRLETLRETSPALVVPRRPAPLTLRSRLLVSDIDGTLIGDRDALATLLERLELEGWGLGIATGRRLESALEVLEEWGVPTPDVTITAVGAEIHYGPDHVPDDLWSRHLDYRWRPEAIRDRLLEVAGDRLTVQAESEQRRHKISFDVEPGRPLHLGKLRRQLREEGLHANLILSHGAYLDALPIRCSKGQAIRWFAHRWGIELESIVVAGDSGNDRDMLTGATPAIVVGNHAEELADLAEQPEIYIAREPHAAGILEGLESRGWLAEEPAPVGGRRSG